MTGSERKEEKKKKRAGQHERQSAGDASKAGRLDRQARPSASHAAAAGRWRGEIPVGRAAKRAVAPAGVAERVVAAREEVCGDPGWSDTKTQGSQPLREREGGHALEANCWRFSDPAGSTIGWTGRLYVTSSE